MDELMKALPRISIITPSFNQAEFLEETILSVLSQGYPGLEYIIIDGGSQDGSVSLLQQYQSSISYWCSEKDSGQAEALNKGFRRATGEIIAWINSDDLLCPGALLRVGEQYRETGFDFLVGRSMMTDEKGNFLQHLETRIVTRRSLSRYWSPHFCPPQPSVFFRRSCLEALGPLDERLHFAMDFDLWMRAAGKFSFFFLPVMLSKYRVHPASKTGSGEGLYKFIPEWRQVITRTLRKNAPAGLLRFWLEEWYHMAGKDLLRLRQRLIHRLNYRQS